MVIILEPVQRVEETQVHRNRHVIKLNDLTTSLFGLSMYITRIVSRIVYDSRVIYLEIMGILYLIIVKFLNKTLNLP